MLNVSPLHRDYETLPGLNNPEIPAVAPLPAGSTEDVDRIVERFGETEIHQPNDAVVAEHDVLGGDVTMDDVERRTVACL